MTREEKTTELIRHRDIILAAIDYIVAAIDWDEIAEHREIINEHYARQKRQTEKYLRDRRLDRLQQKLENLIKGPQGRGDFDFEKYIKQKTGYELDIFEKIRKRTDNILEIGHVRDAKDLHDVAILFIAYGKNPEYQNKLDKLKVLLIAYGERKQKKPQKPGRTNNT